MLTRFEGLGGVWVTEVRVADDGVAGMAAETLINGGGFKCSCLWICCQRSKLKDGWCEVGSCILEGKGRCEVRL